MATTMNGSGVRNNYGYDEARPAPLFRSAGPSGKALVDGYMNGTNGTPRLNPLNTDRTRRPDSVDLKDPIQVHLLTETALVDSKGFEILSQEEVDDLKKQIQLLTVRIEQARANLVMQSKFRDAATSMAKLYSPTRLEGKRRSLLGNRTSGGGSAREAELERQASERRCEELASELFSLEKRLMDSQSRLLQHTAGILQMTHRASTRKTARQSINRPMTNGIPGSPESLYTYSNGRNSLEPPFEIAPFDDWSLYMPSEDTEGQGRRPRTRTLEIPVKSPVREQNSQLREEADRLKEQNVQLIEAGDQLRVDGESMRRRNAEQSEVITDTALRLEELNNRLHEILLKENPTELHLPAPNATNEPGSSLQSQLEFYEEALAVIAEGHDRQETNKSTHAETAVVLGQVKAQLESLNRKVYETIRPMVPSQPPPADLGVGLNEQLDYLQNSLQVVDTELKRAVELSNSANMSKQTTEQIETVLMGLWEIIQSGYASIKQQRADRRRTRREKGLEEEDEDTSGDEVFSTDEPFSVQAFSTKVQWLYAQATSLQEQKDVLKRQIKQQRELNNQSDSEKDLALKQKQDELERTKSQLDQMEKEAQDGQQRLATVVQEMESMQQSTSASNIAAKESAQQGLQARDATIASLQASSASAQKELQARDAIIASLQASSAAAQTKLSAAEENVSSIQAQLEQAREAKAAAEDSAAQMEKDLKEKDEELESLNMMVIELKTEATIAKAELDGAYGSRAQRAKEAAALTNSEETALLSAEVDKLKAELASTLKGFEEITKETIAAEKEKLELEGKLDDALAAKTSLEAELQSLRDKLDREVSSLREQLDAEKLKVPASTSVTGGQRAGATMLSEQFRVTMKEERKKFQDELREEQSKRRKLEDEVRSLKRMQTPGRSPLGPLSPRSAAS